MRCLIIFFRTYANKQKINLPVFGEYAVGMFFLPQKQAEKEAMLSSIEDEVSDAGFRVIGARDVPYVYESCGPTAQKNDARFCAGNHWETI